MFASKSILEHLARGIVGFGALAWAVALANAPGAQSVISSIGLSFLALVALRGCPVCWSVGMFETLRHSVSSRNSRAGQAR